MMNIYNSEIQDGLESAISNNALAYSSNILTNIENIKPLVNVAQSSIEDMFDFYSIMASVGWNGNDDVFTVEETWSAKDTPVHKKVNFEHNENDIIGVITSSIAIDQTGQIILDNPPDQFDIAVSASLYKIWKDQILQDRMDSIIAEILDGKWYVSMECWFKNFDYAVIKDGKNFIVPRNESTAFLTKYLRIYGGSGTYDGCRIGRLLRDFTFSGKGIVRNPANKRSVILNTFNSQAEMKMENTEQLKNELTLTKSDLDKALAKIAKLEQDLVNQAQSVAKSEQEKLTKQIAELNDNVAESEAAKDKMAKDMEEKDAECKKMAKCNQTLTEELEKAKAEIQNFVTEKKLADRRLQLVTAGITNIDDILNTWASVDDKQFEQVISLVKQPINPDLSKAELEAAAAALNPDEEKVKSAEAAQSFFKNILK